MNEKYLIQPEVTFGGCKGGCGKEEDPCFVRKLPQLPLTEIPGEIRKTLSLLHKLCQNGTGERYDETLVISSALCQSDAIIGDVVDLYNGKLKMLCLSVGDTDDDRLSRFSSLIPRLQAKLTNNRQLSMIFGHTGDETEKSIFSNFDRALRYMFENGSKIPEKSTLGVGFSRNNSKNTALWLKCYRTLLDALIGMGETSDAELNKTIMQVRKLGALDITEPIKIDTERYPDGFNHLIELKSKNRMFIIAIQIIPAIPSLEKVTSLQGQITPLIAPSFVAPFHNIYAMNNPLNRITHIEFREGLSKISACDAFVSEYNKIFLKKISK